MTEQLTEEHAAPVVEAGPIPVAWATVPKVNLLPVEIVQGRRFRRTQRMLGAVVLGAVLLAAAGTFVAQRDLTTANDDLTVAQSQVTARQAEAAKYAAVPAIIAQVEAATTARTEVMANDVLWYRFLNDLQGALPSGVSQDTIAVGLAATTAGAPAVTVTDPLSEAGMGTLTISGSAGAYEQVSAWLDALSKITGVSSATLTSATKSTNGTTTTVKYSISAVVTDAALSHRYDKEGS